jgi:hypothetical protein
MSATRTLTDTGSELVDDVKHPTLERKLSLLKDTNGPQCTNKTSDESAGESASKVGVAQIVRDLRNFNI